MMMAARIVLTAANRWTPMPAGTTRPCPSEETAAGAAPSRSIAIRAPRFIRPPVAGCAASGSYCGRASIRADAPRAGDVARPGRAPSLELPAANPNISPLFLTSAQANAYANAATNDSRATRLSAQFLHEIQRYSPQRVSVSAESLPGEK